MTPFDSKISNNNLGFKKRKHMNVDIFDIADRVVVVTGGLGLLGQQYTRALLERNARVVLIDLPHEPGKNFFKKNPSSIKAKNFMYFSADVTRRHELEASLKNIKDAWGIPHALINNAALDSPPNAPAEENGPFETYPESSWDNVMNVNTKGVLVCSQVIGGAMAEAGRGAIVNICSIYGLVSPDQRIYAYRRRSGDIFFKPVAYAASKSALLNLTRYMATYWAQKGVRVNTLTLGGVISNQDSDFLEGYCARVPLGRMARPDEYSGAILFMISDASSYMTGSNLVIDGGWTAW